MVKMKDFGLKLISHESISVIRYLKPSTFYDSIVSSLQNDDYQERHSHSINQHDIDENGDDYFETEVLPAFSQYPVHWLGKFSTHVTGI